MEFLVGVILVLQLLTFLAVLSLTGAIEKARQEALLVFQLMKASIKAARERNAN